MDATITDWCSCNEEAQWHSDCSHNNNNNNNNIIINNTNNSNNNNPTDTQVTFKHSKAIEMRQTNLQRQRELQQSPASPILSTYNTPFVQSTLSLNCEKSSHSSPLPHRVTRRKRLQRQKPTELDDVDVAYAADLEEEYEEEVPQQQQQQQQPTNIFNTGPLLDLSYNEQVTTPTYANKILQHFHQHLHTTPFDGQPSSLPNAYASTTSMMSIHQYHHHHHQHLQHRERRLKHEESFDSSTTTTTNTTDTATSPASPSLRRHNFSMLKHDNSTHSESSSHYSSVDSLLEARKPDPEAILINLGFGPVGTEDILSRIPKRFLKPSQVRGIDTEAFIRRLQLANNLADHSVLGYRGLTGNPDIPPSLIVAKIMQRFEVNERKKSMGSIEQTI